MKRIFTILSFCLPLFALAQSFELDPSEDIYKEHLTQEYSGDMINVKNISGATMTINYEALSNTFLDEWGCTFCAGDGCFNNIPDTETLGQVEPGEASFMSISMYFGDYVGEGTVILKVFDANNPATADTISVTYKVTEESTGTNDLVNEFNFSVNPNPTMGDLNIINDQIEEYQVSVYSITGQLILNEKVSGKSWTGDISNQNSGIYILTVTDENGLVFRRKISKI
jgi:hypothetical protein